MCLPSGEAQVAIIVPTLGRAHKLAALAENIDRVTPEPYNLLFVVDRDDADSQRVIAKLTNAWMTIRNGTYPEKINAGVKASVEPIVVLTNDDVVFHPEWYERAMKVFEKRNDVMVVGPSDTTPATAEGTHATMPIVRRSYIEDPGAAYGEPGVALHEGYHHNWSETELWALANDRGVAKFVSSCVIEHRHPDWGTAAMDDTYERGARQHFDKDQLLFNERVAAWQR